MSRSLSLLSSDMNHLKPSSIGEREIPAMCRGPMTLKFSSIRTTSIPFLRTANIFLSSFVLSEFIIIPNKRKVKGFFFVKPHKITLISTLQFVQFNEEKNKDKA
jgi:hypothetical protein